VLTPGEHMTPLRVGFIGTGLKTDEVRKPGPMGYGMAHHHAVAYRALPKQRFCGGY